ncbi:helix-turn-helix domain-containing protein [Rothia terrae]|uniref:helix-turn-helix domain-containing protein n=1 Tax=Rothia terrae TaxID=396015 RepID=UPI00382C8043
MSYKYMQQGVRVLGLSPNARSVLWVLADITDDTDESNQRAHSWLSQQQLMVRTGIKSQKTLKKAITELRERKIITVDYEPGTHQGRHQYFINETILEQEYELGKAQVKKMDREIRETESQRMRDYRQAKKFHAELAGFLEHQEERAKKKEELKKL